MCRSTMEQCLAAPNCSALNSLILISRFGQGQAGLADRQGLIHAIAVMARWLCSRVVVARPCDLLNPAHNEPTRAPISCTHEWSRYFTLTDAADNNSMLVDHRALARLRARCRHEVCKLINGTVPVDHIRNANPPPAIVNRQVLEQFDAARATAAAGQRFVWQLDHYFFTFRHALRQTYLMANGAPCAQTSHVKLRRATETHWFVRQFELAIGRSLSSTVGVHVRVWDWQDDAHRHTCDTSPASVARWLACGEQILSSALPNDPSVGQHLLVPPSFPRGAHFLVFSNNESTAEATIDELRRLAGPDGSAYAGDKILRALLADDFNRTGNDNFLVMQIIHELFSELPRAVRVGYGGVCLKPLQGNNSTCDQPMVSRKHGAGAR